MKRQSTNLTSKRTKLLHKALLSAFPSSAILRHMVRFNLGQNLEEIAGSGTLAQVVFELIEWARSQSKLPDLVQAACAFNPDNQELQKFAETIFTLRATKRDLARKKPVLPSYDDASPTPPNLPAQPTPFIGRVQEITTITAQLQQPGLRLVTLTGTGGVGKTRLAVEIAGRLSAKFHDGVFFINLAPLKDPEAVATKIGRTLGFQEVGSQSLTVQLSDYLRARSMLLVLDDFEQVIDAASLVAKLLAAASDLRVLATSRERLHLRGEHEVEVKPLVIPDYDRLGSLDALLTYESVYLFQMRAAAIESDFHVTMENAAAIVEICHRLDGLPLALELAAARIKILTPQAILARLDDRLSLLTDGDRDAPDRQKTLRATIEWSYGLLILEDQQLFRRLAVFVSGQTLDAIEAICFATGDSGIKALNAVGSLVAKSLLQKEVGVRAPRFVMLETIREYAREQLAASGELDMIGRRHAMFFLAFAEQGEASSRGAEYGKWLAYLEEERDNLHTALAWALRSQNTVLTLKLSSALWHFWWMHGHLSMGRRWLNAALESPGIRDTDPVLRAQVLHGSGRLAWAQSDYVAARNFLNEGLALVREAGARRDIAPLLSSLGTLEQEQGNYKLARAMHEQCLALRREFEITWGVAASLSDLAMLDRVQGYNVQARNRWKESLALFRELGDKRSIALVLRNLGNLATTDQHSERYITASALLEESLELQREVGSKPGVADVLHDLGLVATAQEDYASATQFLTESLRLAWELGDKVLIIECLVDLVRGQGKLEQIDHVLHLLVTSTALLEQINAPMSPIAQRLSEAVSRVRAHFDGSTWDVAWARGRAMPLDRAIEEAIKICES